MIVCTTWNQAVQWRKQNAQFECLLGERLTGNSVSPIVWWHLNLTDGADLAVPGTLEDC